MRWRRTRQHAPQARTLREIAGCVGASESDLGDGRRVRDLLSVQARGERPGAAPLLRGERREARLRRRRPRSTARHSPTIRRSSSRASRGAGRRTERRGSRSLPLRAAGACTADVQPVVPRERAAPRHAHQAAAFRADAPRHLPQQRRGHDRSPPTPTSKLASLMGLRSRRRRGRTSRARARRPARSARPSMREATRHGGPFSPTARSPSWTGTGRFERPRYSPLMSCTSTGAPQSVGTSFTHGVRAGARRWIRELRGVGDTSSTETLVRAGNVPSRTLTGRTQGDPHGNGAARGQDRGKLRDRTAG